MDLVTPAIALPPGRVIASLNYEPVPSGYRRLGGFERYDGHMSPSGAQGWTILYFTQSHPVNGVVSTDGVPIYYGAQDPLAYSLAPSVHTGGPYPGGGDSYVIVGEMVGPTAATFEVGQIVQHEDPIVGLQFLGTITGVEYEGYIGADEAAFLLSFKEGLRNRIQPVPGSGPVRGVAYYNSRLIAVRDNAAGTAGVMHLASIERDVTDHPQGTYGGWYEFGFLHLVEFSAGTNEIEVGQIITDSSGGAAIGTVRQVALESGTWAGGDAAGRVIYRKTGAGAFAAAETIHVGTTAKATVAADEAQGSLPPGGDYEFDAHNFYGAENLGALYGVNGVGPAFALNTVEGLFDEAILTTIPTGMPVDQPDHLAIYGDSLFLSFPGGSIQFSQPGEPMVFDVILGAGEIGIGDGVTKMVAMPESLAILGACSIHMLYGNDITDYTKKVLTREAGSLHYSAQRFGDLIYMDNRGLRTLSTTSAFGNFKAGTLSQLVAPLIEDYRKDGIEPTASLIRRAANQYWLFFSNGTALIMLMGGKVPWILPVNLGLDVTCATSAEDNGEERIFLGTADGWVMELNRGNSFDGDVIEHYIRLPFNHFGSPQFLKTVGRVVLDVEVATACTLEISADFDYGSVPGTNPVTAEVTVGGGAIDDLGTNELYFASQIETQAEAYLDNICKNISLKVGGVTIDEDPHTLTGVTFFVTPKGMAA